jgi:hypothetical protein
MCEWVVLNGRGLAIWALWPPVPPEGASGVTAGLYRSDTSMQAI